MNRADKVGYTKSEGGRGMRKQFGPFLVLVTIVAIGGCAAQVTPEKLATIENGRTTEAEVLKMFGEPQIRDEGSSGDTWTYAEEHSSGSQVIWFLLPVMGDDKLGVTKEFTKISFKNGVVSDIRKTSVQGRR